MHWWIWLPNKLPALEVVAIGRICCSLVRIWPWSVWCWCLFQLRFENPVVGLEDFDWGPVRHLVGPIQGRFYVVRHQTLGLSWRQTRDGHWNWLFHQRAQSQNVREWWVTKVSDAPSMQAKTLLAMEFIRLVKMGQLYTTNSNVATNYSTWPVSSNTIP